MTEIPVDGHGKFYLVTVIDLYSRRCLAANTNLRTDANLARSAIQTAVTARSGPGAVRNVIFHTDRGSTYTADRFTTLCRHLQIQQSMGRVGSCFDNAAAEAFFSSLQWEVLHDTSSAGSSTPKQSSRSGATGSTTTSAATRHTHGLSPVNFEALV